MVSESIKNLSIPIDKIKEGLEYFKNQEEQIPPMTSSIKINGKKLMLKERSKYDANDARVHENISMLKEDELKVKNDISVAEKEIE